MASGQPHGVQAKEKEKDSKSSQPSGFLNSFLSFINGGTTDVSSPQMTVSKPVIAKYVPEVRPAPTISPANSPNTSDPVNPVMDCTGDVSLSASLSCELDNSCDVPELSPVSVKNHGSNIFQNSSASSANDVCLTASKDNDLAQPLDKNSLMPDVKETVGTKRQLTRGCSTRKRHRASNYSDDEQSVKSSSSEEVQTKSSALTMTTRRRSARQVKDKGNKRRSIYFEPSDTSGLEDEEEEADQTPANRSTRQSERGDDYDSDSDPVWMPGVDEQVKRSDFEEPSSKRKRGRPVNNKNAVAKSNPKESPEVIASPLVSSTTPAFPTLPNSSVATAAISVTAAAISVTATATSVATPKTPTSISSTTIPNRKYGVETVAPVYNGPPESDAPHKFGKGEFVIDRRDFTNYDSFPIWKIDSGRLLQKYEPIERNGRKLHRSLSTYSSWTDQIHYNYKAIEVMVFSAIRGQEVVEVTEMYRPKAEPYPSDKIKESFNVYIQILVSQSLESTFLSALVQAPDQYYMDPLNTIDGTIMKILTKLKESCGFVNIFSKNIDKLTAYKLTQDFGKTGFCQATSARCVRAVKTVKFFGYVYDFETLQVKEELDEVHAQEHEIGEDIVKVLPIYHSLRHIKMELFEKCQAKVKEVKKDAEMDDHEILDKCLADQAWISEMLQSLLDLIRRADSFRPSIITIS